MLVCLLSLFFEFEWGLSKPLAPSFARLNKDRSRQTRMRVVTLCYGPDGLQFRQAVLSILFDASKAFGSQLLTPD